MGNSLGVPPFEACLLPTVIGNWMKSNEPEVCFIILVIAWQRGVGDLCLSAPIAVLRVLQTPIILKLKLLWESLNLRVV